MGMEMELDFGKTYPVDQSPKTVLVPSQWHHHPSIKKRNSNSSAKPVRGDDLLNLSEDFLEIDLSHCRSVSCKSVPSRPLALEGVVELKQASVYQSSREIQKTKNMGTTERRKIHVKCAGMSEERKKIEISRDSNTTTSSSIWDSFCSSDEGSPRKRSSPAVSLISSEVSRNCPLAEMAENSDRVLKENANFRCEEIISRANDGNVTGENEMVHALPKLLPVKLQLPHSPSNLESGRVSSKVRFYPIRKMFDPLRKSKSLQNHSVYSQEHRELRMTEKVNPVRRGTSSLDDVSSAEKNCTPEIRASELKCATSAVANSPVHLHGILKLGEKDEQGDTHIEFSMKSTEDVFLAKGWKENNNNSALNCIYSFHTLNSRKGSIKLGMESVEKDSTIVGQMQVSCYLHSELKSNGILDNSLVMESVLYDIAQARRSTARERSSSLAEIKYPDNSSSGSVGNGDLDSASSFPWRSGDRNSDLEIAATVIEVPCEKTEMLLQNGSEEKVRVLIPSGSHGMPESDGPCPGIGPSSLLERWRSGGGCDCGGWDMGCPLTVLGCPVAQWLKDQKLVKRMNRRPLELHVQVR